MAPQDFEGKAHSSASSRKQSGQSASEASQKTGGVVKIVSSQLHRPKRNNQSAIKGHTHHRTIATLLAGDIFGEMAILRPEQSLRRTATVKARDYFVELFEVSREDVVNTGLTYPKVREYLLQLAETRAESYVKLVEEVQKDCNKEAQEYWGRITRAKTQHAMMKARALVKISRGPLDWPGSQGNSDPGEKLQHKDNGHDVGETRQAKSTHQGDGAV